MFKISALLSLVLFSFLLARAEISSITNPTVNSVGSNWNGYLDTVAINDTIKSTITTYTKGFKVSPFCAWRVAIMANDTSVANLGADSLGLIWGYQGFHQVLNSAGTIDTILEPRVVLDTFTTATFGTYAAGSISAAGVQSYVFNQVDTSSVTGYAVQERSFTPPWNVFMRFFVTGTVKNAQIKKVKIRFVYTNRTWTPTQQR